MKEAEYLMKNYGDRGGAETDNTLRDLHNSLYDTKTEFNNCVIIHSKLIIPSLKTAKTCLPTSMLSSSSIVHV